MENEVCSRCFKLHGVAARPFSDSLCDKCLDYWNRMTILDIGCVFLDNQFQYRKNLFYALFAQGLSYTNSVHYTVETYNTLFSYKLTNPKIIA